MVISLSRRAGDWPGKLKTLENIMNRFTKLTLAAAALTMTALSAVPASAADIVVNLRGKTAEQVSTEIQTAALKVCRAEVARVPLSSLMTCASDVAQDAMNQLPARFGR